MCLRILLDSKSRLRIISSNFFLFIIHSSSFFSFIHPYHLIVVIDVDVFFLFCSFLGIRSSSRYFGYDAWHVDISKFRTSHSSMFINEGSMKIDENDMRQKKDSHPLNIRDDSTITILSTEKKKVFLRQISLSLLFFDSYFFLLPQLAHLLTE